MSAPPDVESAAPVTGLSDHEAALRLQGRAYRRQRSRRSYASIVRANVLTIFNLILVGFGTLTLVSIRGMEGPSAKRVGESGCGFSADTERS